MAKRSKKKNELATVEAQLLEAKSTADMASQALHLLSERCHLVTPATSVTTIPEGCEIVPTLVAVDVEGDTYPIAGSDDRGLGKTALNQIAAGLGVSWDPVLSRRLDDGSDPHYCHYRAVGHYRAFDGSEMTIDASREMDLRDGSPQIETIVDKAQTAQRPRDPTTEIRGLRQHILSHAETKAKLRAIRSMGIRTAYSREDLAKPFCTVRIMFTGRTDDPQLRRDFAHMTAAAFMGAKSRMYGPGDQAPARALPMPHAPPTLPPRPAAPPPAPPKPRPPAPPPTPKAKPAAKQPEDDGGSGFTVPGGREKGKPLHEASTSTLEWWERHKAEKLESGGDPRYAQQDRAFLAAIRHEIAQRGED